MSRWYYYHYENYPHSETVWSSKFFQYLDKNCLNGPALEQKLLNFVGVFQPAINKIHAAESSFKKQSLRWSRYSLSLHNQKCWLNMCSKPCHQPLLQLTELSPQSQNHFLQIQLNIILTYMAIFPKQSFPSRIPTKTLYAFLISTTHVTCLCIYIPM